MAILTLNFMRISYISFIVIHQKRKCGRSAVGGIKVALTVNAVFCFSAVLSCV